MLDHCDVFNHNAKVGTKKSRRKNYSVGWEFGGVSVGVLLSAQQTARHQGNILIVAVTAS